MTDAEYDGFASELTTLCRRYSIRIEVDEATDFHALAPGFYPHYRYVVGHDSIGGVPIKLLTIVLDESAEVNDD